MLPIRLSLKNFCGHSDTEFSFDDFQSALIIGKVKNNDRFSNGAGKSTIFNAIEYVLFNEIQFSALEKIIRDGCDIARVEFDFISSLDKGLYRIVRSNSRKTGTDVRLSKKDGDEWQDLTQRRVSDTEKEIVKIVGFNYKAFCSSVLFSQSGSENNVQRDFGNLPALTPEKRKSVLREVLQLNIYSNYEKLAKNKFGSVQTSLEKQKIILSTIGDPDGMIQSLTKEQESSNKILSIFNHSIITIRENLAKFKSEYTLLSDKVSGARTKINELTAREINCKDQVSKSEKTILDLKNKISTLPDEAKLLNKQLKESKITLEDLESKKIDVFSLKEQLNKIVYDQLNNYSKADIIQAKVKEANKSITHEEVCTKCYQTVPEQHRHDWEFKKEKLISTYKQELKALEAENYLFVDSKSQLEKQLIAAQDIGKKILDLESKISFCAKEIEYKRSLYTNYSSLLEEHITTLKDKGLELESISKELSILVETHKDNFTFSKLDELRIEIHQLMGKETQHTNEIATLIGQQAIIQHKIEQCIINKQKIVDIKKDIQDLEKSLLLHSKVIQAFGSNGIPSLITHSILDELQGEANKWLVKLRPGLQLQFVVINDKNNKDKEKEDTLDILYFIDGNQREYKQLSGAQKIIVSLSIKLAILFIMNKRLGVDIKLMLLDEVDQPLDPGSTEIFSEIIKVIQSELKVLVITHDDELKHKFSHAILVEQDENNVSQGKLVNW